MRATRTATLLAVWLGSGLLGTPAEAQAPTPPKKLLASKASATRALSPYGRPAVGALSGLYAAELLARHQKRGKQSAVTRSAALKLLVLALQETRALLTATIQAKGPAAPVAAELQPEVLTSLELARAQQAGFDTARAHKLATTLAKALLLAAVKVETAEPGARLAAQAAAVNAIIGEDGLLHTGVVALVGEDGGSLGQGGAVALVGERGLAGQIGVVALVGEDGIIGEDGLLGLVNGVVTATRAVARLKAGGATLADAGTGLKAALDGKLTAQHRASLAALRQRNAAIVSQLE